MLDLFEIHSIRKFMIRLFRKVKDISKNSIKINSKFVRFDSNKESNFLDAGFVRNSFDSKIYDSIDTKGGK